MNINISPGLMKTDELASQFINIVRQDLPPSLTADSEFYFHFPVLRDLDDNLIELQVLMLSKTYGVLAISTTSITSHANVNEELAKLDEHLNDATTMLRSRLLRNKSLVKGRSGLLVPIDAIIFAPNLDHEVSTEEIISPVCLNTRSVIEYFRGIEDDPLSDNVYRELVATLEGAKGLLRSKARPVSEQDHSSKGYLANLIDAEIASFDERQKVAYMGVPDGLHRIRGLAGSGKTVVLAMKAAITHIRNPDAHIVYTFYTKSLYQHVQRLITRFYRQYDDKDPDWSKLHILHAWGGQAIEGVYYNICRENGTRPHTFSTAARATNGDPFDYACKTLLSELQLDPMYDFAFIDEGQDFPASFFQLCLKVTHNDRVTFAYDDLQTIFQAATPTLEDIIGPPLEGQPLPDLKEDTVLYKCYRNPRAILVCAHALGFGIYGQHIVQMLENREQWRDIGYEVESGEFVENSQTVIKRPESNTLKTISQLQKPEDLIQVAVFDNRADEIVSVCSSINDDIKNGLRPEDIVVIVVDDKNAKDYLQAVEEELENYDVATNNIHSDRFFVRDFHKSESVTLTTVHKAKGNEGFMVYIVGMDGLFTPRSGVRQRNQIFTAMTRAKGWVRISGVGSMTESFKSELSIALSHFPKLVFKYPDAEQIKILRRDLAKQSISRQDSYRKLDEVLDNLTTDEVQNYLRQKHNRK